MPDSQNSFQLPPPEELSTLLTSYSEISFLAQGGMAAVYKAVQTSLDRPVAIKVLPREFGADEPFRLRFEAEAKTMARLNHPNLVSIFDFGEVQGLLYLTMEFVEGNTLYEYAYGKKLDQIEALNLTIGITEGLAHAHENGILHRDIKPSNILLDERKNPKLGDFGLAQGAEREEGDNLTFGTPGYTAPEVFANPDQADQYADIYAIGILLYELLTTQIPTAPYVAPSQLVQSSPEIDAILAKCLQPDPQLRQRSAHELAKELKQARKNIKNPPKGSSSASGQASPSAQKTSAGAGLDFTLFRNLIIIGLLGAAVWGAWTIYQARIDDRDQQQIEQDELAQQQKKKREAQALARRQEAQNARRIQQQANNLATTPTEAPNSAPTTQPKAAPSEQLAELKTALASGEHEQFPDTTVERNGSRYFFVESPLTWHEAITFAENHGGHLVIMPSKEDLNWLATQMAPDSQVWLGAGATSREDWAWFDHAIAFEHRKPNISLGSAATLTDLGILKGAQPSARLPFFIEWKEGETAPLRREKQLVHLLAHLDSNANHWPAGTLVLDERRYLIIGRPYTLAEAKAFAAANQGHLAVPSSEREASFLQEATENSGLSQLWIGAQKDDAHWSWSTNEPWTFAHWSDEFPSQESEATGLVLTTGGWQNVAPSSSASGFIIEWSDDANALSENPVESAKTNEVLDELQATAKRVARKNIDDHLKSIKLNSDALGSMIRQWFRSLSQQEAATYEPRWKIYQAKINSETGRLAEPSALKLPSKATELLFRHYNQQKKLDAKLKASSNQLRNAYIKKLSTEIEALNEQGLRSQAAILTQEIESVGKDSLGLLDHFGMNPIQP